MCNGIEVADGIRGGRPIAIKPRAQSRALHLNTQADAGGRKRTQADASGRKRTQADAGGRRRTQADAGAGRTQSFEN